MTSGSDHVYSDIPWYQSISSRLSTVQFPDTNPFHSDSTVTFPDTNLFQSDCLLWHSLIPILFSQTVYCDIPWYQSFSVRLYSDITWYQSISVRLSTLTLPDTNPFQSEWHAFLDSQVNSSISNCLYDLQKYIKYNYSCASMWVTCEFNTIFISIYLEIMKKATHIVVHSSYFMFGIGFLGKEWEGRRQEEEKEGWARCGHGNYAPRVYHIDQIPYPTGRPAWRRVWVWKSLYSQLGGWC